jgi:DNA polymerase-3 subunit alpha
VDAVSFVHLHCRTHYSFLDGAMSPAELVDAAVAQGQTAVAMTDSANLCGLVEFYNACKAKDIKPIFGTEVWIGRPSTEAEKNADPTVSLRPDHLVVLLVRNEAGYRNLCTLLTTAHRQRCYTPLLSLEQLSERAEGLVCLTGSRYGPLGQLGDDQRLLDRLQALQQAFGPTGLYLELTDWGLEDQEGLNDRARRLSGELGVPLIATNSCRYVEPMQTGLYNTMRSIAMGGVNLHSDPILGHLTDQATVKSEAQMLDLFEAEAVHRTAELAEELSFVPELGGTFLPNSTPPDGTLAEQWAWLLEWFPIPKAFGEQDTSPPTEPFPEGWDIVDAYFAWYAKVGLEVRLQTDGAAHLFGTPDEYRARLDMELGVIQRMKFPTYHLIVAEFTNWAKDNGIGVGPGRGSAAGSVIVWSMQITDLNPLQWGLMFERYLNPKRVSMPDIDMDFEQERREEVIEHVRDKYGDECVAQILTIGTMKAKAALKDCARACAVHYLDADRWSKELPEGPKVKLKPAISESKLLTNMYGGDAKFHRVVDLALSIEGRPRQTGVHAAGVIITSRPVSDFIPLHYENGTSMTGLEMNGAEKMGLVKFDFLGLKTLDIIEEACRSIEDRTGQRPEVTQPLFDDPGVYELMSNGDTLGLFQVESHGMQNLVRRMRPDCMEDLIAILALYRPGPLGSGMVDQYIECKHGRMEVVYPHELLTDTLKPTHGVIVYQEQVMKAAQALASDDLAVADLLRRAMGKKKQAEMDKQRALFVEGCGGNGIDEADATRIFNLIDHFAGYGFNKSHSASYAVITYMTAYLKAHFRADLMAAAMSLEQANREKLVAYVHDTQHADIAVLGPDINASGRRFTAHVDSDRSYIRFGLEAIKGVGGAALDSILRARAERPFTSLADLQDRTTANKTVLQALVYAGALDAIEPDRFEAWWALNKPKIKSDLSKKDSREQLTLFGGGKTAGELNDEAMSQREAEVKPERWTYAQRLDYEAATLGCWLSGHPLDRFADVEQRSKTVRISELETKLRGDAVTLIGIITKIHKIKTRSGSEMTFFTLADRTGMTEVVLRPQVWEQFKALVVKGDCVQVNGAMDRDGAEGRVVVSDVQNLADIRSNASTLELVLPAHELSDDLVRRLKVLLDDYIVGQKRQGCRLRVLEDLGEGTSLKITLPGDPVIEPDRSLFDKIETLTGRPNALRIPGEATELAEPECMDTPCVTRYGEGHSQTPGDPR